MDTAESRALLIVAMQKKYNGKEILLKNGVGGESTPGHILCVIPKTNEEIRQEKLYGKLLPQRILKAVFLPEDSQGKRSLLVNFNRIELKEEN